MSASAKNSFAAVLFDCDGVLVDSEAITCGVLRDMFEEQGWRMTLQECMGHFVGHTVRSLSGLIEANTRQPLTDAWMDAFYQRRNEQLVVHVRAVEGIHDAVSHLHKKFGTRLAVASGADRFKIELMLKQVGLYSFFEGRIFSGHEVPRTKPYPDVYLAAMAHLGVEPAQCLVVEDSPIGARAGVAAGATVWGYAPPGVSEQALWDVGVARVMRGMGELGDVVASNISIGSV